MCSHFHGTYSIGNRTMCTEHSIYVELTVMIPVDRQTVDGVIPAFCL